MSWVSHLIEAGSGCSSAGSASDALYLSSSTAATVSDAAMPFKPWLNIFLNSAFPISFQTSATKAGIYVQRICNQVVIIP